MKLSKAWRMSRIPYGEVVYRSIAEERGRMWWGAFGRKHSGKEAQNNLELTKRALRIAKFDKLIVAVFNVVVSGSRDFRLIERSRVKLGCHFWVYNVICDSDVFIVCERGVIGFVVDFAYCSR